MSARHGPSSGLGVDLGTTNTKVATVVVRDGEVCVQRVTSAPTPSPARLRATLAALVHETLDDADAPAAVGIASMAETGVPLGADDAPLGAWVRWNEGRSGDSADALATRLGWDQLVTATGVRPSGKVPLAMWTWLRDRDPATWARLARWAGVADLACLVLTGRLATDHTLAGRTMAYRPDLGSADGFDAALLGEAGLRPDQLPEVVPPGEPAGTVIETAFGLRAGTPVVIAGHDHAVGAWASGVRTPGEVADSVGTAEAVLTVVAERPDPVAVAQEGMSTVVSVDGQHWAVLAGSPGAGALVDWFFAHEVTGADPGELFAEVLAAGDGPGAAVVLPYLRGRQAPDPDPDARVRIVGRSPDCTPADLARALVDGLSLQARWLLEAQADLTGTRPGEVTVFGSPVTGNPAWLRTKVQSTPAPVRVVEHRETVAIGAALRALVVAGEIDGDTALPGRGVPKSPDAAAAYDRAFETFVAAATGTGAQ